MSCVEGLQERRRCLSSKIAGVETLRPADVAVLRERAA